jgi:hypothetical protein
MASNSSSSLRPLQRYITTHDPTTDAAIFLPSEEKFTAAAAPVQESLPGQEVNGFPFYLGYTTHEFPVNLAEAADLTAYRQDLVTPPGLIISTGSVCRIVDFPPATISAMHRSVSLDYGVVIEGEVELVLDSGETRRMKPGDLAVQRSTNHAWRNVTPGGGWARMLYVLLPAIQLEGKGELIEGIDIQASQ